MKNLLLLCFILLLNLKTFGTTQNASTFGYNATDATTGFQNAINNSLADTIIIDFVGNGEWIVGPSTFFNLRNKTILFALNVKLIAKSGVYFEANSDCLIRLKYCDNVKLVGNNTLLKMQKAEYTSGDSRHAISIFDSDNISIKNFTIIDTGGDGIYIVGARVTKPYSENITISNVVCSNNRRQGISIISVQNLLVEHCVFKNTNGTLPEAGVDLEPDADTERLVNIEFRKCSFTNNNGAGIALALLNLTASSVPVSITFNDCYISQNHNPLNSYATTEIDANSAVTNFGTGQVTFNRCLVENSQWSAVFVRKAADSYGMTFNDCVFKNVSQNSGIYINPIWLETLSYDPTPNAAFGGLTFNNQLIDFNGNKPFLQAYGSSSSVGLKKIFGNITVRNPTTNAAPIYNDLAGKVNVTFTYNFINSLPTTTVNVSNPNNQFFEVNCDKSIFNYTRNTTSNTLPIPINYTLTGSAIMGVDYYQNPPFVIIPSGQNSRKDTLWAVKDTEIETDETINFTTNTSSNYSIGNGNFSTALKNGNCNIEPQPSTQRAYINEVNPQKRWVEIYNPSQPTINLSNYWLANGNSTIQITNSMVLNGNLSLDSDKYVVLNWAGINQTDGELALYNGNPANGGTFMKDYVQYGSAVHLRSPNAVTANVWNDISSFSPSISADTSSYSVNGNNVYMSGTATNAMDYVIQRQTPSIKNLICLTSLNLNGNIIDAKYTSGGQINLTGNLTSTSFVNLRSPQFIELKNTTIMPLGARFEVKIGGCN